MHDQTILIVILLLLIVAAQPPPQAQSNSFVSDFVMYQNQGYLLLACVPIKEHWNWVKITQIIP
jgi:hypothetical protein